MHGSKFTVLQLHIWTEMIASGLHTSTEELPYGNSMFQRAGGDSYNKKIPDSGVAQALAEAASAITSVLTGLGKAVPPPGHGATNNRCSPARLIDSRSKLYKQLSELQNSKSMGILNDAEYAIEKETTMDLLKQLKGQ